MKYINIHTHSIGSDGIEIVNMYPRTFAENVPWFSIGIHPWYIAADTVDIDLTIIEEKIQQNNCLAIGECGLDKKIDTPFDLQISVFESQLILAEKYKKPVIIHCVAAFQELLEIKNRLKISVPMIIHGYSKNAQLAEQLLQNGFYLSWGKQLLRDENFGAVFKTIPNDRFFLETDSSEFAIAEIYRSAALHKSVSVAELADIVHTNFQNIFEPFSDIIIKS